MKRDNIDRIIQSIPPVYINEALCAGREKRRPRLIATVAAAVLLVLAAAGMIFILGEDKTKTVEYFPEDYKLVSLSFDDTGDAGGAVVPYIRSSDIEGYAGEGLFKIRDNAFVKGHENCTGVYFDISAKDYLCIDSEVRNALDKTGVLFHTYSVIKYSVKTDKCLVKAESEGNNQIYYVCFLETKLLQPLPDGYTCDGPETVSPDLRYLVYLDSEKARGGANILTLIDTGGGQLKYTDMEKPVGAKALTSCRFSSDSGVLYYDKWFHGDTLPDEIIYAVYCPETGCYGEFEGSFIGLTEGNSEIVFHQGGAAKKYSVSDGVISPLDGDIKWGNYRIIADSASAGVSGKFYTVTVVDAAGNTAEHIKPFTASVYFRDNEYLYYYSFGDSAIVCLSIVSGKSCLIAVPDEFVSHYGTIDDYRSFRFTLFADRGEKTVYLSYVFGDIFSTGVNVASYTGIDPMRFAESNSFESVSRFIDGCAEYPYGCAYPSVYKELSAAPDYRESRFEFCEKDGKSCLLMRFDGRDSCIMFCENYSERRFEVYSVSALATTLQKIEKAVDTPLDPSATPERAREYLSRFESGEAVEYLAYRQDICAGLNNMSELSDNVYRIRVHTDEKAPENERNALCEYIVYNAEDIAPLGDIFDIIGEKPLIPVSGTKAGAPALEIISGQDNYHSKGQFLFSLWCEESGEKQSVLLGGYCGEEPESFRRIYEAVLDDDEYTRVKELINRISLSSDTDGYKAVFDESRAIDLSPYKVDGGEGIVCDAYSIDVPFELTSRGGNAENYYSSDVLKTVIPRINDDSPAAVAINEKIVESCRSVRSSATKSLCCGYDFLFRSFGYSDYEYWVYGGVLALAVGETSFLLGSDSVSVYTLYYYDTVNKRELSADEYERRMKIDRAATLGILNAPALGDSYYLGGSPYTDENIIAFAVRDDGEKVVYLSVGNNSLRKHLPRASINGCYISSTLPGEGKGIIYSSMVIWQRGEIITLCEKSASPYELLYSDETRFVCSFTRENLDRGVMIFDGEQSLNNETVMLPDATDTAAYFLDTPDEYTDLHLDADFLTVENRLIICELNFSAVGKDGKTLDRKARYIYDTASGSGYIEGYEAPYYLKNAASLVSVSGENITLSFPHKKSSFSFVTPYSIFSAEYSFSGGEEVFTFRFLNNITLSVRSLLSPSGGVSAEQYADALFSAKGQNYMYENAFFGGVGYLNFDLGENAYMTDIIDVNCNRVGWGAVITDGGDNVIAINDCYTNDMFFVRQAALSAEFLTVSK